MNKSMQDQADHGERISKLETAVVGIDNKLGDVTTMIRSMQQEYARSRKTDWGVVFAGLLVAGALYGAAIRPLSADTEKTARATETLSDAVTAQNERQVNLRIDTAVLKWRLDHLDSIAAK